MYQRYRDILYIFDPNGIESVRVTVAAVFRR